MKAVVERTRVWCFGDTDMSQAGPVLRCPKLMGRQREEQTDDDSSVARL